MESKTTRDPRKVFVVHGRNSAIRDGMFAFLRSIDLKPIEWTEAIRLTGEGSPYIGKVLDVAFDNAQAIVVLMTPDEVTYLQPRYSHGDDDTQIQPAEQARPNVLFEAGMALGRNSDRTILVEVGNLREFSDIAGRHTIRLTNDAPKRQELAQRLKTAGCAVDLDNTAWMTEGDFTAPDPAGGGYTLGRRIPSAPNVRPPVDFDIEYVNKGKNKMDRLRIINRGTETAYDVHVSIPEESALSFRSESVIEKIPGGGKSVSLDIVNAHKLYMGNHGGVVFDITVEGRSETGEVVSNDVFIDLNG